MIPSADEHRARCRLLLKVALQAQRRIALRQHLAVNRAMRLVAGGAALPHGLVLKYKRPALRGVAFRAGFVLGGEVVPPPAMADPLCGL